MPRQYLTFDNGVVYSIRFGGSIEKKMQNWTTHCDEGEQIGQAMIIIPQEVHRADKI